MDEQEAREPQRSLPHGQMGLLLASHFQLALQPSIFGLDLGCSVLFAVDVELVAEKSSGTVSDAPKPLHQGDMGNE